MPTSSPNEVISTDGVAAAVDGMPAHHIQSTTIPPATRTIRTNAEWRRCARALGWRTLTRRGLAITLTLAAPIRRLFRGPVADHPSRYLAGFCVEPDVGCRFP